MIPDVDTIWMFREHLIKSEAMQGLLNHLGRVLSNPGYLAMSGQLLDVTSVAAPKWRNAAGEKAATKANQIPEDREAKPTELRQKDRRARLIVKCLIIKPHEDDQLQVDLATLYP